MLTSRSCWFRNNRAFLILQYAMSAFQSQIQLRIPWENTNSRRLLSASKGLKKRE